MATGSTSRMLLPKVSTSSNDLESYVTPFELTAEPKKCKRTDRNPAREVYERPHYFAIRLQKSAIQFHRTLPQLQEKIMLNALKLFEETIAKKTVVFRERLARRVRQQEEKLTNYLTI